MGWKEKHGIFGQWRGKDGIWLKRCQEKGSMWWMVFWEMEEKFRLMFCGREKRLSKKEGESKKVLSSVGGGEKRCTWGWLNGKGNAHNSG